MTQLPLFPTVVTDSDYEDQAAFARQLTSERGKAHQVVEIDGVWWVEKVQEGKQWSG